MDTSAIGKAGLDPVKPKLAVIDNLRDGLDVANYLSGSFAGGDMQVFQFGSGADFQHASMQMGYVGQGGLGLPTRDY